jgi:hypothetical protein
MTIFAHGKIAVLRGHFSQMPDSGDEGKSFAKNLGAYLADNQWCLPSRSLKTPTFDIKK